MNDLQSRLDYMIQFLEGNHVKSSACCAKQRDFILRKVKETLAWQTRDRSPRLGQAKIKELDDLMIAILKRL